MRNTQLESQIQTQICHYLTLKKYFFWRNNTTGIYDPTKKVFRRMSAFAMAGVSDILLLKDGLLVCIEVKRPKGIQSEHQKEFEKLVKANGGVYLIATSIDDIINYGL